MSTRNTVGWSLITTGIVTLLLEILPFPSVYWGIFFLLVGLFVFFGRRL